MLRSFAVAFPEVRSTASELFCGLLVWVIPLTTYIIGTTGYRPFELTCTTGSGERTACWVPGEGSEESLGDALSEFELLGRAVPPVIHAVEEARDDFETCILFFDTESGDVTAKRFARAIRELWALFLVPCKFGLESWAMISVASTRRGQTKEQNVNRSGYMIE